MAYKTILLELRDEEACRGWIEAAARLAETMQAELVGMHAAPIAIVPVGLGDAAGYVDAEVIEAQREAGKVIQARLGQLFAQTVPPGVEQRLLLGEDLYGAAISDAARFVDLTIVGAATQADMTPAPTQPIDDVLIHAGGPVIVLPRGPVAMPPSRIVLAWNASRQAARALKDSLPLLQLAAETIVLTLDEDDLDGTDRLDPVLAMLTRHGVVARGERRPSGDLGTSDALLAAAGELGADLLVMGAYSHSRLREAVFGGVTREVLDRASLPVMFSA